MKGAELEIDDGDMGRRFGPHDMPGKFQSVESGIASHKSDDRSFDRRIKSVMLDELEIDARRVKAGAGRQYQMGYVVFAFRKIELIERTFRQSQRVPFIEAHTLFRTWESAGLIKTFGSKGFVLRVRLKKRIAMFDLGLTRHSPQKIALLLIVEQG